MGLFRRIFRKPIKEYKLTLNYYYQPGNDKALSICQYVIEDISVENAFYAACEFWHIDTKAVSIKLLTKKPPFYEYEVIKL